MVRENRNNLLLMNDKWPTTEDEFEEKGRIDAAFKAFKSINSTINRSVVKNYNIRENPLGMPEFECSITLPATKNEKRCFSDGAHEYFKKLISNQLKSDDPELFNKTKIVCSCYCVAEPDPKSSIYWGDVVEYMYIEHYYIQIVLIG